MSLRKIKIYIKIHFFNIYSCFWILSIIIIRLYWDLYTFTNINPKLILNSSIAPLDTPFIFNKIIIPPLFLYLFNKISIFFEACYTNIINYVNLFSKIIKFIFLPVCIFVTLSKISIPFWIKFLGSLLSRVVSYKIATNISTSINISSLNEDEVDKIIRLAPNPPKEEPSINKAPDTLNKPLENLLEEKYLNDPSNVCEILYTNNNNIEQTINNNTITNADALKIEIKIDNSQTERIINDENILYDKENFQAIYRIVEKFFL